MTRSAGKEVDLDAQAFAVEVIQHIQQPELAAIPEPICHEVHRPGHVRRIRHRQSIGLLALQPFARLDPQVQLQRAIDPIDAFVVPGDDPSGCEGARNTSQSPKSCGHRSARQKIGDLLILALQLRAVAKTGLVDPEGPASQRNADLVARHLVRCI